MKATVNLDNEMSVELEGSAVEIIAAIAMFMNEVDEKTNKSVEAEGSEKWWSEVERLSSSKNQWMPVSEMSVVHLANALVKEASITTNPFLGRRNVTFTREMLLDLMDDRDNRAMMCELATRIEETGS